MIDVSIVIPVYNGEKTIRKTLDALLNQKTKRNYEIIVVDDGSTDRTPEILKEYSITVITQENAGASAARNKGWKASSGKIVAFTDSDCVPVKDWLEAIVRPFKDKSVGGVGGTYKTENNHNFLAKYIGEDIKLRHSRFGKEIEATGTFSVAFRKNLLEKVGGFDETYQMATAEDFDLCFAVRKEGHKIVYEPNAIVGHFHEEHLLKFLKTQFRFAYWRVYLYYKFRNISREDQYTLVTTLIQIPLTLLLIMGLLTTLLIENMILFPIIIFIIIMLCNLPFFYFEIRSNVSIASASFFLQFMRNFAWTFGFIFGFLNLFQIKQE